MRAQTYTGRTQWIRSAYALLRKLLWYIVGLGRVELPTSRLSGPQVRKQAMSVYGGFTRLLTSRLFRREREKGQKPPPARTQDVHAKELARPIRGQFYDPHLTNRLARFGRSERAQFELEQAVRREVRDFAFRRWN